MEFIVTFLGNIYNLFNTPMDIYGFIFSFWDVLIFGIVVSVVFGFVRHMFFEN